ncbi:MULTISPECIES: DUF3263 domain-containing protein [Micrococcales]|uniref:DUF3263 domain-containing protein n=1 Tax=Micrococcales TaxID=85006 RepID=UPI000561664A|nr:MULTISPECIES: DUF3263 domain-containing protein [Micrococcales]
MESLTEVDLAIIAMEKRPWKYPGAKERAVRTELGISGTEYYMRLNRLIDDERAIRMEPALMRRLRDHRDG